MRTGRGTRLLKIGESRTRMRGQDDSFRMSYVERDLNHSLRNGTKKKRSIRKVGSLGSESIYTNTCQFEVRGLCCCTCFTRKPDHSRQQQTAISAFIAE